MVVLTASGEAKVSELAVEDESGEGELLFWQAELGAKLDEWPLLLSLFASINSPQTVPVKIAFDSESVLGMAEHIDPGLETFVEIGCDN